MQPRLAYVEVLTDERAITAVGFLRRAVAHFASYGIRVERVRPTTPPPTPLRPRARLSSASDQAPGPYRPRINGKAERFIRTMLASWAYGAIYGSSEERQRALPGWLAFYNRQRPHGNLSRQAPIERLLTLMNNAPDTYKLGVELP